MHHPYFTPFDSCIKMEYLCLYLPHILTLCGPDIGVHYLGKYYSSKCCTTLSSQCTYLTFLLIFQHLISNIRLKEKSIKIKNKSIKSCAPITVLFQQMMLVEVE